MGRDVINKKGRIVNHGQDNQTRNDARLLEFCVDNNLLIINAILQHEEIYKSTRVIESRGEKSIIVGSNTGKK